MTKQAKTTKALPISCWFHLEAIARTLEASCLGAFLTRFTRNPQKVERNLISAC